MNKNDLIDALVPRLGDRASAALAVEAFVDVVLRQVSAGGSVGITGFGTFEPVERAPRTGRNPHTGEAVPIPATRTPRFRPGSYFKDVVADPERLPATGLAGARVGTADEGEGRTRTRQAAAGRAQADDARSRPSAGAGASVSGHGTPSTIRRSASGKKKADAGRSGPEGGGGQTRKSRGRGRTGTPATVRAERQEAPPGAEPEPSRDAGSGGRLTIGGEQITQDMITAKKAQLARAKDDHVGGNASDRPTKKDKGKKSKDAKGADAKKAGGKKAKDDKKGKDGKKGKGKKS